MNDGVRGVGWGGGGRTHGCGGWGWGWFPSSPFLWFALLTSPPPGPAASGHGPPRRALAAVRVATRASGQRGACSCLSVNVGGRNAGRCVGNGSSRRGAHCPSPRAPRLHVGGGTWPLRAWLLSTATEPTGESSGPLLLRSPMILQ